MRPLHDLRSQRFGRLTAVCLVKRYKKNDYTLWLCRCDCGNLIETTSDHLLMGHTKSCGCLNRERIAKLNFKHGATVNRKSTRLYRIWISIKGRCLNSNKSDYKYYGKKGIVVCDEWKNGYMAFRDWALTCGYEKSLTIDRINSNGDYEPSNCRWITASENTKKSNIERAIKKREHGSN